jgi:hypothetical protein
MVLRRAPREGASASWWTVVAAERGSLGCLRGRCADDVDVDEGLAEGREEGRGTGAMLGA